jgi:hypothetical protein
LKAAYDEVLVNWLQEGIIEDISMSQWDEGHYLPHKPVVKESGTTKVRPVFDASFRERGQPSLKPMFGERHEFNRDTYTTTAFPAPPDWNHSGHSESIFAD